MYGFAYPPYFRNDRRIEIMKRFVTSKVINKINDNYVLNEMMKLL